MASKRRLRRQAEAREKRHAHTEFIKTRFRVCHRKCPFPTLSMAESEMKRLMESPYYDGLPLNAYRCPVEKTHFHFGHLPVTEEIERIQNVCSTQS